MSRESADHSLPYILAITVLEREIRPDHYDEQWRRDTRVHDLMERVTVDVDPDLDRYVKSNPTSVPAIVELRTVTDTFTRRIDYPSGHAARPLSNADLEDKFRSLAGETLDPTRMETIIDICSDLRQLERVSRIPEETILT